MIPFRDNVPARRYPVVVVIIIIVNVVAFLYETSLPPQHLEQFIGKFGLVPAAISSPQIHPVNTLAHFSVNIFTAMFLHGGWLHLLGNMWYLWIFGDNVEDRMGHGRFLFFYLLCGVFAAIAHVAFNSGSNIPSIGASGAIAGVLGAYLLSYPFARVLTLVPVFIIWPIIELPAILVLGFWFFLQILNGTATVAVSSATTGGVAWWAHVGGFVAGMALLGLFKKESRRAYYT